MQRLIAAQFPRWAGLPLFSVAQGWSNRSFRLGEKMVVRLPSGERYSAQVEKEHWWLPKLAAALPLPIPTPLALGTPALGYPWRGSIYRWIPGDTATDGRLRADRRFGEELACFLTRLHAIDATGGPLPGAHNFHRGGALEVFDAQVRQALPRINNAGDVAAAAAIWEMGLSSCCQTEPRWLHGDFAPGNLLIEHGRLSAVIDFGNCGVGDPACDLAIAWTFLRGAGREAFRNALPLDDATWDRARGWVLWKALILMTGISEGPAPDVEQARAVFDEVLTEPL